MTSEADLQNAMIAMYKRAGRETGYWGNYFLRSVRQHGGLETAKRMLNHETTTTKGFAALINARRADLSLEALVLRQPFRSLFSAQELKVARDRLNKLPKSAFPKVVPPAQNYPDSAIGDGPYEDGAVRKVLINWYERNSKARKICLAKHGIRCAVCRMSFEERYGSRGRGFIHVHHLDPLGRRKHSKRIDPVKDLIPVCPNCHAMLHASSPPINIEELVEEVRRAATGT
jgi:5-methylcytosine-specific restriction enzyme A